MNDILVSQIMIPVAEYATGSQEATLCEAIVSLDRARAKSGAPRDKYRAILVRGNTARLSAS
jgi:hypothetical protein